MKGKKDWQHRTEGSDNYENPITTADPWVQIPARGLPNAKVVH